MAVSAIGTCQLELLATVTNVYSFLAAALKKTAEACGATVGPVGVNVLFLDFYPGLDDQQLAIQGSSEDPASLVNDLNRATVLKFQGCSWVSSGSPAGAADSSVQLKCPGWVARPAPAAVVSTGSNGTASGSSVAGRALSDATAAADGQGAGGGGASGNAQASGAGVLRGVLVGGGPGALAAAAAGVLMAMLHACIL